jgi:hypothetical protein
MSTGSMRFTESRRMAIQECRAVRKSLFTITAAKALEFLPYRR